MWTFGKRKARRLLAADQFRMNRRATDEDITVLGEQLSELHVDTLTVDIDDEMREDYQRALDAYEKAKLALRAAATSEDVATVNTILDESRFARACVLARRDGLDLPKRRESCFFNPQHGPAATDADWKPSGGVARSIPVCRNDANRLANGELPPVRMVRTASGLVPWYAAGEYLGGTGFTTAHVHGDDSYLTTNAIAEAQIRASTTGPGGIAGGSSRI
ncbi:hypothetical protein [Nocardioides sp.]|uniref:hypothetical protein n=1 Tax=Nocardioides sp. TaxID=35761 RepID=UPI0031FEB080|nr:hypothetical protein [Nocardioides sp.]